jgi:hypothetical protein
MPSTRLRTGSLCQPLTWANVLLARASGHVSVTARSQAYPGDPRRHAAYGSATRASRFLLGLVTRAVRTTASPRAEWVGAPPTLARR